MDFPCQCQCGCLDSYFVSFIRFVEGVFLSGSMLWKAESFIWLSRLASALIMVCGLSKKSYAYLIFRSYMVIIACDLLNS